LLLFILSILTDKVPRAAAEVFAALYDEFMPKIYKYISFRIADTDDAQDITATVFEKALANFENYSAEKAKFSTWIFSIARNALIDHYRYSAKQKNLQAEATAEAEIQTRPSGDDMFKAEDAKVLRTCLSQLAPQEQEVISLKFGSGMTNREIAKQLKLSESNVGVIAYRAVRKLRDKFTEVDR
jgi:RNA polymerase sigma factor (sigma-70 family)